MAAKRNSPGQGSIYKDGTGFAAQLRINGTRYRRRARTKKEAQQKLDELRREHAAGLPIQSANLTVGNACSRFLEFVAPSSGVSPSTLERYEWAIEAHFLPAFGKKRLRDLTPMHVEAMLRTLADDGKAQATLQKLRSILHMILDEAEKQGWISRNVAKLAKVPPARGEVASRSMTESEAKKLLACGHGTALRSLATARPLSWPTTWRIARFAMVGHRPRHVSPNVANRPNRQEGARRGNDRHAEDAEVPKDAPALAHNSSVPQTTSSTPEPCPPPEFVMDRQRPCLSHTQWHVDARQQFPS